jgi:hypothetical protein
VEQNGIKAGFNYQQVSNLTTYILVHFGDDLHNYSDIKCFIFHNINRIKDETNWVQINQTMYELDVTGFSLAEINRAQSYLWQTPHEELRNARGTRRPTGRLPKGLINNKNTITQ